MSTVGWAIKRYDEVDSTMNVARKLLVQGAQEGTTVVAETQNQARGRRGRSWFSKRNAGLWFTTILTPPQSPQVSELALIAGLSVLETLHHVGVSKARLKWPNDILVERRKLAGILLEAETRGARLEGVLVGIGLNLASEKTLDVPQDLCLRYTGVLDYLAQEKCHPEHLFEDILAALKDNYRLWCLDGWAPFKARWEKWDCMRGHQVKAEVNGELIRGVAGGVGPHGSLYVDTVKGRYAVTAGEVLWNDVFEKG
jgi:BirA family transcriptional regulator, biotin operon repressor / biotin---[acetyl-CoA-carboxylase] ligase